MSTQPQAYPWKPAPVVWLALAGHVGALALWLLWPQQWGWALLVLLLCHLWVTVLVMLPRNHWMGRNLTRLPAQPHAPRVAITIDDGPDPEVTPQVLEILAQYQAKASFFCIGKRVEQHPELARAIVAQGHGLENHGYAHSNFLAFWGSRRIQQDLARMQNVAYAATGVWPRFFRPTAGFRNPWLDPVLARMGLQLAMWSRRGFDTRTGDAQQVLHRLEKNLDDGAILLLHDGHSARTPQGQAVIVEVLPILLQKLQQRGLSAVKLEALP